MFTKIGKNLPDHHLLFYSSVLIVLSFLTIFNPYFLNSISKETIAAPEDLVITILSPSSPGNYATSSDSVNITGTSYHPQSGAKQLRWKLNESTLNNNGASENWSLSVSGLNYGKNTIYIEAEHMPTGDINSTTTSIYRLPENGDSLGFAWSENFGWISFSSLNDGGASYGLNIDPITGNLSGYAWSEYAGWISFEEDAPSYTFYSNCYTSTCVSGSGCSACYNPNPADEPLGTGKLYGWAKVLVLGDNGWIRLDDDNSGDPFPYGVKYNIFDKEFFGYAWNRNSIPNEYTGLGWISFNCLDSGNDCAVSDYKVMANLNRPPTATISPSGSENELPCGAASACISDCELNPVVKWDYDDPEGFDQYAYRVVVRQDNLPPGSLGFERDTGKVVSTSKEISINEIAPDDYIVYGQDYYINIMVWDNFDLQADNWEIDNFTTHNNKFPVPYFNKFVPDASEEEEILFWDTSLYFPNSALTRNNSTSTPASCQVSPCSYSWSSISDVTWVNPLTQTQATTTVIFNSEGNSQNMTLTVTDGNGYSCSTTTNSIEINKKLPSWIEAR